MPSKIFTNFDTSRPFCWAIAVSLAGLLLGCAAPAISDGSADLHPAPAIPAVDLTRAQFLPIGAEVTLGDRTISLEVTRTAAEQAKGLMFRPALPDDRGMLFVFEPARPVAFWMKNVPVPLDMVFIRNGRIVAIAARVPPCTQAPCAVYPAGGVLVDRVVELRAGLAAELGLRVGDRAAIRKR